MMNRILTLAGMTALLLAGPSGQATTLLLSSPPGIPSIPQTPNYFSAAGTLVVSPGPLVPATIIGPYWSFQFVADPVTKLFSANLQHLHDGGTGITPGPMVTFGGSLAFPVSISGQVAHGAHTDYFDFFTDGHLEDGEALTAEFIVSAVHVPEPQHYALAAGLGLAGFGVFRRLRRR